MGIHTILGAGGAISNQLLPVLLSNNEQVRLVSRHAAIVPNVESVSADITDYQQTLNAVKGSSVVYLLVGLPYDVTIWRDQWPTIMTNVIKACKELGASLLFFDNIYMYGKVEGKMTESTPFHPCSKKGEIRAAIATLLLNEIKTGSITALIARSADFYGPAGDKTSVPNMLVFANLKKGKKPQWLVNAEVPHSFTYIPDAAKALYLLSNDKSAFGQTWHLPTSANPLTGNQFIAQAASLMKRSPSFSTLPKWMLVVGGIFDKTIKESYEMLYQSEFPYLFDSSKFEEHFNFHPTTYAKGIEATAKYYL